MVEFKNTATAEKFECSLDEDQSVVILQARPAYRGRISLATPEACEQMIKEGITYIKRKEQPDHS